jgi:glycosyltransferase involved in cell wall biosynthesis
LNNEKEISLSVVIITYNEEKNIGRCLDSVVDFADEIVIVDSFSKDKTKEICSKYNVKFVEHKFEGHIEQKNYAISQASSPFILSLDADEVVSGELKKSILAAKKNWDADGYCFNRLTNYCGKWIKHTGWYPDKKLRLWDSRKGRWTGQNPHDKYVMQDNAVVKHLKGDLLHYSISTIDQHIVTVNKFSSIAAETKFIKGTKSNLFKIMVYPFWKFIRHFIIHGGFLDGHYGFVISVISSHATFLRYVKLRELNKKKK